jgi:polyhydroxyalkanoate synthesis regulator phasin
VWVAVNQMPDDAPSPFDAASTARALEVMRKLPLDMAEGRIAAVGAKCEELLRGQIAAIHDASPAWKVKLKASWWDDQLAAIRHTLDAVAVGLPDELAAQVGPELVRDVRKQLAARTDECVERVLTQCESVLEIELPDAARYRAESPVREQRELLEELEERVAALESQAPNVRSSSASLIATLALVVAAFAWCSR